MTAGWPARIELCALVQRELRKPLPEGATTNGALVAAIRSRWPHLEPPTALHLARIGQLTNWDPEPRPEPKKPRRMEDALLPPVTLRDIAAAGAKTLFPVCRRCSWEGEVSLAFAMQRLGAVCPVEEFLTLLVCTWCAGRAHKFSDDRPPAPGTGRRH